ncbi:MAG TPA: hypothetical protein VFF73_27535 [Planctomycetota bacterium]|nr:hypothetical protein [Planctomycetota bacterium]
MRQNEMGSRLRRAVWAAATITALAALCGGCCYVMPTTSLDPQPQTRWVSKDVPVPDGFVLDEKASKIMERGARTYYLVYKRKDYIDMDRTFDFYKEACSSHGWDLHFLYGFDKRGLIFFNDQEELRVTIERSLPQAVVWVTVELEPREHAQVALADPK